MPDAVARKFRRGYYAAVSQTDHNFGVVRLVLVLVFLVDFLPFSGWWCSHVFPFAWSVAAVVLASGLVSEGTQEKGLLGRFPPPPK